MSENREQTCCQRSDERTDEKATENVLENLTEKVVDRLKYVQTDDISFLNQDDGDFADLVVTVSLPREAVEDEYGTDVAARLWNDEQRQHCCRAVG